MKNLEELDKIKTLDSEDELGGKIKEKNLLEKEMVNNLLFKPLKDKEINRIEYGVGDYVCLFSTTTGRCLTFFSKEKVEYDDKVSFFITLKSLKAQPSSALSLADIGDGYIEKGGKQYPQHIYFVSDEMFAEIMFSILACKEADRFFVTIPKVKVDVSGSYYSNEEDEKDYKKNK